MIVLDASVAVELLRNALAPDSLTSLAFKTDESFIVPHFLDVEVVSAFRRLEAAQRLDLHRTEQLVADLAAFPAERYPHTPLLPRIWELRHNFTAYDAAYIALAEVTNSVLLTSDRKLLRGHRAQVMLFE